METFPKKYPFGEKILSPTVYQPPTDCLRIFMFVKHLQYTYVFIYTIRHVCVCIYVCMSAYVYSV